MVTSCYVLTLMSMVGPDCFASADGAGIQYLSFRETTRIYTRSGSGESDMAGCKIRKLVDGSGTNERTGLIQGGGKSDNYFCRQVDRSHGSSLDIALGGLDVRGRRRCGRWRSDVQTPGPVA